MKLSTTLIAMCVGTGLLLVVGLDNAQAGKRGGFSGGMSMKRSGNNNSGGLGMKFNGQKSFHGHVFNNNKHQNHKHQHKHNFKHNIKHKIFHDHIVHKHNHHKQHHHKHHGHHHHHHCDFYCGFYFKPRYVHYYNPYCLVPYPGAPVIGIAPLAPPQGEEQVTEKGTEFLQSAREAFLARDYDGAMSIVTNALQEMPNNANAHQLRSLIFFAKGEFREAAGAAHVALTSGRGWNWTTLKGFYQSADEYTAQLRGLENSVKGTPNDAASRFLLAYHYMMMGHAEPAMIQLQAVVSLQPKDELAAGLLKMVSAKLGNGNPVAGPAGQDAPTSPNGPSIRRQPSAPVESAPMPGGLGALGSDFDAEQPVESIEQPAETVEPTQPVVMNQVGVFKAAPAEGIEIRLELRADGSFLWSVDAKGKKTEFSGTFTVENNALTLVRKDDGQKLSGSLTAMTQNGFNFKMAGTDAKDTGLNFTRTA